MATTSEHIAARSDTDLFARLVAAAEMQGIPNASAWVQQSMGTLLSTPIEDGKNITDIYAYAYNVRKEYLGDDRALPPGQNLGAVTDAHMATAITSLLTPPEPPANQA
jgi:hypothetical protein